MDSLISRQAAIDALGEKPLVWDDLSDFDLGKAAQWSDDVDAIKELPSAQPQLEECPIYGGMCGYPSNLCYECPRHEGAKEQPQWWTEGLQPFAQPKRWILVTERLPDEWKRVLIQNDEGLFLVGFVKDRGWGKEWFYQYEMYDYDAYVESEQGKIVAWCELPDRWKG